MRVEFFYGAFAPPCAARRRNRLGRIRLRYPRYHGCIRCLRFLRRAPDSHLAWNCGRVPRSTCSSGRNGNRCVGAVLPLFHRVLGGDCVLRGKPLALAAGGARRSLWGSVWRGCLLFHEPCRGAPFRRAKIIFLMGNDVDRSRDPHRLRWSSDSSASAAIFGINTVPKRPPKFQ